ncbi:MAG: aspartate:alanine exchanger family transporter [Verrucomicrobiota bacterium]|nr:aspartate:alanine exchanger family transporter [Verrucomicrobiota bacterium]
MTILQNPLIILFVIIALGLLLGKIKVCGLSLGSSGVLFVALLFGHLHCTLPAGVGTLGLILFVYCIGLTAGPSFFSAIAEKGITLALLSIIAVILAALTTIAMARLFSIRFDLAVGLFAGALTSTPGLASAMDALKENPDNMASIGYGIAYPFGVVGVVLFIQLLPRFLKKDLQKEANQISSAREESKISRILVKITNPQLTGKRIMENEDYFESLNCRITRVMNDVGRLVPLKHDEIFQKGQLLLLVGKENKFTMLVNYLGEKSDKNYIIDADNERKEIIVTSKEMVGKTISELQLLKKHGVSISRVTKDEETRLATSSLKLKYGDTITAIGQTQNLQEFTEFAGNQTKALHITDLISLSFGLSLGILFGSIPVSLPGLKTLYLGMAGGPLFVALILSYFRSKGVIPGKMPQASRVLMMDLGLVFFLANAGIKAGHKIIPVLQQHGFKLFFAGMIITLIPMIVSYIVAAKVFKMNIVEALGGICGGMTSTPSLGALSSKVDSDIPVTSYATAYPVALILMTIATQIVISILK